MNNEQEANKQHAKPPKPHTHRWFYIGGAALIVLAVLSTAFVYNRQLSSLKAELAETENANVELTEDKADLAAKNKKLAKATKALQTETAVTEDETGTETTEATTKETAAEPATGAVTAGELTVVAVKKVDKKDFSEPYENPMPSGEVQAIYVIIKNTSGATQNYNVGQFRAITDNGESLMSHQYGAYVQRAWHSSDLVNGGSKEVALMYGLDKTFVSLEWTPPGGTETLTLPVPAMTED